MKGAQKRRTSEVLAKPGTVATFEMKREAGIEKASKEGNAEYVSRVPHGGVNST